MQIIDCKKLAQEIQENIKKEIETLNVRPGLAVLFVGEDGASKIYIKLKEKACNEVGIYFEKWEYAQDIGQAVIVDKIKELNNRKEIHGVLVQMPLPKNFNVQEIIENIDPKKDVDGFHAQNIKNYFKKEGNLVSPLIQGILEIIRSVNFNLSGKKIYILAKRSPFSDLLEKVFYNFDVENVLISDENLSLEIREADLVVVALGKEKFLKSNMVKDKSLIIDVGINKNKEGKIVGDIDRESFGEKAGLLTPVPGGVGPMTVAMLLQNVLCFYKNSAK
ncbi:MAG: bifunctional 5,10-methylenetetrahydrofolate dehydrogenase/5,10-methenyltetrahydrofolate cyclohydrolase [Patescibacteria group bacterium]